MWFSFYSRYKGCVDKNVDFNFCVCVMYYLNKYRWLDIEDLICVCYFVDFGMISSICFFVFKCLLVMIRYLKWFVVFKK